jgi:hypothetical protein
MSGSGVERVHLGLSKTDHWEVGMWSGVVVSGVIESFGIVLPNFGYFVCDGVGYRECQGTHVYPRPTERRC